MNPYLEGIVTKIFFSMEGADAVYRVMNSAKPMKTIIKSLKSELALYAGYLDN